MALTLEQAKALSYGDRLYSMTDHYAPRSKKARLIPCEVKVNGKPQTWKTRPNEIRIPAKYGLRGTFQIYQYNLDEWTLDREEAESAVNS